MAIYKNKDIETNINERGAELGNINVNFYTEDNGTASIRIKIKNQQGVPINFNNTDILPRLDIYAQDGSIFTNEPVDIVLPEQGLIQYKVSDYVIRHEGKMDCKLFLENGTESVHVANFYFVIKDSGITGAIGKEIRVEVLEDMVRNVMTENAMGLLDDTYKEKLDNDLKDYLVENKEVFQGVQGDIGPRGIQGVRGRDAEKAPVLPIIVNTPSLFNWKNHPLKDRIISDGKGEFDVRFDVSQYKLTGGKSYYIDAINGNNANDGLTLTKAIKDVRVVAPKLNDNDTLYFSKGDYLRNNGVLFPAGFNKSINMIALDDDVNLIAADEPNWIKTTSTENVYEVTRSAVKRVINLNNIFENTPQEFKLVNSIEQVNETPYSFYTDNVKVYINCNGVPNKRIIPLLETSLLNITNPSGNFYIENINFYGGQRPLRFVLNNSNNVFLYKVNMQFACQISGNGLEIVGGNTIISQKCIANNNQMDGFNYHIGADGSKPNMIEIDCIGLDNGYEKGTAGDKSNNGSTLHDGLKGIRVNGIYGRNDGGNVADVNEGTQSWNLGCVEFESYQNRGYQASDGSQMFLDSCIGYGSANSIHSTYQSNKIYIRMGQYQNKLISAGEEIKY